MRDVKTKQNVSATDLLKLQDDNGTRYELIDGTLVAMSPTGYEHGHIELNIGFYIRAYLKKHKIGRAGVGEIGFYTRKDTKTVRAADAVYISYKRLPKDQQISGYLTIAPNLVVEVISPHDRTGDIADKTREWLDFGVDAVWNIYPMHRKVEVFIPDADNPKILFAGDLLHGGEILPDFSVQVTEIFED